MTENGNRDRDLLEKNWVKPDLHPSRILILTPEGYYASRKNDGQYRHPELKNFHHPDII